MDWKELKEFFKPNKIKILVFVSIVAILFLLGRIERSYVFSWQAELAAKARSILILPMYTIPHLAVFGSTAPFSPVGMFVVFGLVMYWYLIACSVDILYRRFISRTHEEYFTP